MKGKLNLQFYRSSDPSSYANLYRGCSISGQRESVSTRVGTHPTCSKGYFLLE